MSFEAVRAVLERSNAKSGERMILIVLAEHANEQEEAWPSIDTMAAEANLSERMVRYTLRNLEILGEIQVVKQGVGRKNSTVYRITLPEKGQPISEKGAMDCPIPQSEKGQWVSEKGQPISEKGAMDCPRTIKNHQEPSIPPKPPEAEGREEEAEIGRKGNSEVLPNAVNSEDSSLDPTAFLTVPELKNRFGPMFGLNPNNYADWTRAALDALCDARIIDIDMRLIERGYRIPAAERRTKSLFLPQSVPRLIENCGDVLGQLRLFFGAKPQVESLAAAKSPKPQPQPQQEPALPFEHRQQLLSDLKQAVRKVA